MLTDKMTATFKVEERALEFISLLVKEGYDVSITHVKDDYEISYTQPNTSTRTLLNEGVN